MTNIRLQLLSVLAIFLLALLPSAHAAENGWWTKYQNVKVENVPGAGFRVVSINSTDTLVLAFGDEPIDFDNPSPEFLYLLDTYDQQLGAGALSSRRLKARRKASYTNIPTLMTCHWAQSDPFNRMTPVFKGYTSHTLTGCVATAMAQVLYTLRLPQTMHGIKTYSFTPSEGQTDQAGNSRVTLTLDYSTITLDWANLIDSPWNRNAARADCTEAQGRAVSEFMYACGVAASMNYGYSGSGAMPEAATNGINSFFDGVRASHEGFNEDVVLSELRAGRPVIYSAGGHCFVIDGARSDGYLHCNLGWGGGSDGYYLPTDMAGYNTGQNIVRVWPDNTVPTYSPVADLTGKYATTNLTPATSITEGQWYIMWNSGRSSSACSLGTGQVVHSTAYMPNGDPTNQVANQLIRFVRRSAGGYYIQTGLGDYFGSMSPWGGTCTTTSSQSAYYTVSTFQSPYFKVHSENGNCYVDANAAGSTLVGWNPNPPTDIYSNSSWLFYPVTLSTSQPEDLPTFKHDAIYTLRNYGYSPGAEGDGTGYSHGYLVVDTNESSERPTMRGVDGVHPTANQPTADIFKQAPDWYNEGSYWRILTENGKQYLQNVGTGKYLTNTGNRTHYVLTSTKTPINIGHREYGATYRFNSGTDSQSFLCAAVNVATASDSRNPAAFWTAADRGSIWTVEEAVIPVDITGLSFSSSDVTMARGDKVQLSVTVTPSSANNQNLTWTSSNTSVAEVTSEGTVIAVADGDAIITVRSVSNSSVSATCTVHVKSSTNIDNFSDFSATACYTITNPNTGAHLVSVQDSDTHPTVRDVSSGTAGAVQAYYSPADLSAPGSYWQVVRVNPADASSPWFYLYNLGTQQYLAFSDGNYSFTTTPTPLYLTDKGTNVFYINWGEGYTNSGYTDYLALNVGAENPASKGGSSAGLSRYWTFSTLEGVTFPDRMIGAPTTTVTPVDNMADISADEYYTVVNPQSTGYLVTTSETDTYPTLRGVTVAHSQGCRDAYRGDVDFDSPLSYWRLTKVNTGDASDRRYYMFNVGTKKYLTFGGKDGDAGYVLTDEPTAVYLTDAGSNIFNICHADLAASATDFMCAATFKDHPASWWTASDDGSKWRIELRDGVNFDEDLPDTSDEHLLYNIGNRHYVNKNPGSTSVYMTSTLSDAGTMSRLLTGQSITYNGNAYDAFVLYDTQAAAYIVPYSQSRLSMVNREVFEYGADRHNATEFILVSDRLLMPVSEGQVIGTALYNEGNEQAVTHNTLGLTSDLTLPTAQWAFTHLATPDEQATASTWLSKAGQGVGYPAQDAPESVALTAALNSDNTNAYALNQTIEAFQQSPIVMPESGKAYYLEAAFVNAEGTTIDAYTLYSSDNGNGTIGALLGARGTHPYDKFIVRRLPDGRYALVNELGHYLCWFDSNDAVKSYDVKGSTTRYSADANALTLERATTDCSNNEPGTLALTALQRMGYFQIKGQQKTPAGEQYLIFSPSMHRFVSANCGDKMYQADQYTFLFRLVEAPYNYNSPEFRKADAEGTDAYATVFLPFSMTLPAHVKAYGVTEEKCVDGTYYLHLEKAGEDGSDLAAGAYILYSNEVSGAQNILPALTSPRAMDGNALFGSTLANATLPLGDECYVLSGKSGIGFYLYTGSEYPLGKAIYSAPYGSNVAAFRFAVDDDETADLTAISTLLNAAGNGASSVSTPAYDLAGRRTTVGQQSSARTHGILISEGKKIIR